MSETALPDPSRLKHKPIFLLPYAGHDGPFANATDCLFLSLGWAQYDPRSASVKSLRYTGEKWSRQSEEVPLHRAVDMVALLALALRYTHGSSPNTIQVPANFFENQPSGVLIQAGATLSESGAFGREMTSNLVRRRLGKLRDILNELHQQGTI